MQTLIDKLLDKLYGFNFWFILIIVAVGIAGWYYLGAPKNTRKKIKNQLLFVFVLVFLGGIGLFLNNYYRNKIPKDKFVVMIGNFDGISEQEKSLGAYLKSDLSDALLVAARLTNIHILFSDQKTNEPSHHLLVRGNLLHKGDKILVKIRFEKKQTFMAEPIPTFVEIELSTVIDIKNAKIDSLSYPFKELITETIYAALAIIYANHGDFEKSKTYLNRMSIACSAPYKLRYIYSLCLTKTSDYDKATTILRKIIDEEPKFIYAYRTLGSAYMESGNYQDAIQVFEKGREVDPNDLGIMNNLARAYTYAGKLQEAETILESLVKTKFDYEPYQLAILINLANIMIVKAQADSINRIEYTQRAQMLASEALNYAQSNIDKAGIYEILALCARFKKNYSGAEYYLRLAIRLNPNEFRISFNLGKLFARQSNYQAAIQHFRSIMNDKSLAINKLEKASLVYDLAAQYAKIGDADKVFSCLQEHANLFDLKVPTTALTFREFIIQDVAFNRIRNDKRYQELLKKNEYH